MICVIGIGNPLRGDDGVGWVVADRLRSEPKMAGVKIVTCHQLLPEMAADLNQVETVIFVDAAAGGAAGETAVSLVKEDNTELVSTHHLSPAALLAYTELLYGQLPTAYLVTVGGASFDLGESLSPEVAAQLPTVLQAVKKLLPDHSLTSSGIGGFA
ncbi:MAG: hydrogenase maturation protease [Ardenticatenaceae bacterium]|nr:hydrogenase maturation protease [Ardenticatenaceae bacterium]